MHLKLTGRFHPSPTNWALMHFFLSSSFIIPIIINFQFMFSGFIFKRARCHFTPHLPPIIFFPEGATPLPLVCGKVGAPMVPALQPCISRGVIDRACRKRPGGGVVLRGISGMRRQPGGLSSLSPCRLEHITHFFNLAKLMIHLSCFSVIVARS